MSLNPLTPDTPQLLPLAPMLSPNGWVAGDPSVDGLSLDADHERVDLNVSERLGAIADAERIDVDAGHERLAADTGDERV